MVGAADALTRGRPVDWEWCERLAAPAHRRVLAGLRALAGLFAGGRAHARDACPCPAGDRRPSSRGPRPEATPDTGPPAALLVAAGAGAAAGDFVDPDAGMPPLARASAIVHVLETCGGPLRVHPDDDESIFALLPPDDAAWVVETGAEVVVPAAGPGAPLLGVVVVVRGPGDPADRPRPEAPGRRGRRSSA